MSATVAPDAVYTPCGAASELFRCRDLAVLLCGPAGTGKSRGVLEKIHALAWKYPGMRALMLRKTRKSLTQSGMITLERHVLPFGSPVRFNTTAQEYRFPNGSVIVVGGLDDPQKVLSSDYDVVYIQEATEVTEDDLEHCLTRLRNGVMPYQQLLADCNPGPPRHWLKIAADAGRITMLHSRHQDNPRLYDRVKGAWTDQGKAYLATLGQLTGVRRKRLLDGLWAAAEGMIYDTFDPATHIIDQVGIGSRWPRLISVDFGFTNPFVCQWWAFDDDGRAYLYRELYGTGRLVEDWAKEIRERSRYEEIEAVITDHDAEDRATLERHLEMKTTPAHKDVSPGIQAVQSRLRVRGDGKPRIFFLRDALVRRDPALEAKKKPCSTVEEIEGYVWDPKRQDTPVKADDHGMDAMRYMVMATEEDGGGGIEDITELLLDGYGDISGGWDYL